MIKEDNNSIEQKAKNSSDYDKTSRRFKKTNNKENRKENSLKNNMKYIIISVILLLFIGGAIALIVVLINKKRKKRDISQDQDQAQDKESHLSGNTYRSCIVRFRRDIFQFSIEIKGSAVYLRCFVIFYERHTRASGIRSYISFTLIALSGTGAQCTPLQIYALITCGLPQAALQSKD